ncbi:unnamed protein product [Caenorhabditis angaria]|uniref:Uncharacterized protein n=1 Tax=Caenorhabditis angaria TaxID=860376 RepID=A0A9P1IPS4_9PELO|nr:unnamed protein product [Caenorhabditis angaria]
MILKLKSSFALSLRERSSYYQQNNRRFPPAFVRRFWLRHPNAHLYLVFGLCSSAMIAPVLHSCYLYMTMSKSEFDAYRIEQNAIVLERQKYGKGLWFPFLSNKDTKNEEVNKM